MRAERDVRVVPALLTNGSVELIGDVPLEGGPLEPAVVGIALRQSDAPRQEVLVGVVDGTCSTSVATRSGLTGTPSSEASAATWHPARTSADYGNGCGFDLLIEDIQSLPHPLPLHVAEANRPSAPPTGCARRRRTSCRRVPSCSGSFPWLPGPSSPGARAGHGCSPQRLNAAPRSNTG